MSILDIPIIQLPDDNQILNEIDFSITIEETANLTYEKFFIDYMLSNRPVLIKSIPHNWDCYKNWTKDGSINFQRIKECILDCKVPVANLNQRYFNSHEKVESNLYKFLDEWERSNETGHEFLYYLKDWHLSNELPNYKFYQWPLYFASDWLNEYLDQSSDSDYKFVYMGPKRTWTSLHSDVFSSYSWSTNICGRKKWIILLPGEEKKTRDNFDNLLFSIDEQTLVQKGIKHFSLIQNSGDTVFIPSEWYHQVHNLDDTISVNHNWFNACNINKIWKALHQHYLDVVNEISDCRDMDNFEEHCQKMLKASFGMDYSMLLSVLETIVTNREKTLTTKEHVQINGFYFNRNHCLFDLNIIKGLLQEIDSSLNDSQLNHRDRSIRLIGEICKLL